jgi:hypothetical protein
LASSNNFAFLSVLGAAALSRNPNRLSGDGLAGTPSNQLAAWRLSLAHEEASEPKTLQVNRFGNWHILWTSVVASTAVGFN